MFYLLISTVLCATDLWCKGKIDHNDPKIARTLHRLPRKFSHDHFRIDCVHNQGLICNFGDTHPMLAKVLSVFMFAAVALAAVPCCLIGTCGFLMKSGLALIMGGGLSNTIDRCKKGYVVDYLNVRLWKPIQNIYFNLADLGIFFGCILLFLSSVFSRKKKDQ